MVLLNVKMDLMRVIRIAASRSSYSTMIKDVAANKVNSHVPMVIVSPRKAYVMVLLNAKMDLMKETSAVSEVSRATTTKSAVAIQKLRPPAPMANALRTAESATVKRNALINLMKVTRDVASRSSDSTMMPDVVAKAINSNVPTRCASRRLNFAMVLPNVKMDLMRVKLSAASKNIASIILMSVAATLKLSIHALMATVSLTLDTVMVKPNVLINLTSNMLQPRSLLRLPTPL
jgi:hypothetical protein